MYFSAFEEQFYCVCLVSVRSNVIFSSLWRKFKYFIKKKFLKDNTLNIVYFYPYISHLNWFTHNKLMLQWIASWSILVLRGSPLSQRSYEVSKKFPRSPLHRNSKTYLFLPTERYMCFYKVNLSLGSEYSNADCWRIHVYQ